MGDPQYADFPPTGPPYSMEWITIAQAKYKPPRSIPPPTATREAGDEVPRFVPCPPRWSHSGLDASACDSAGVI